LRRTWRQLDLAERGTWERNPTPRDFGPMDTVKPIDDAAAKV
jgi:hypothetical protein